MVENRRERERHRGGRRHSRVNRISSRTNGRGERMESGLITSVVLRSVQQSYADRIGGRRQRVATEIGSKMPRPDESSTITRDRGGLLWSETSALNDRHSVTRAL